MKVSVLSPDEVVAGYDAVSVLYPYVPPLSIWRAWEYAAYRRYALPEPVIELVGHYEVLFDVRAIDMGQQS